MFFMNFAKNISLTGIYTPTKYTVCMAQIYRNGYTVRANPILNDESLLTLFLMQAPVD